MKQDGLVELLLWLEDAERLPEIDSIKKYSAIALRFVTMEEWVQILAPGKNQSFSGVIRVQRDNG